MIAKLRNIGVIDSIDSLAHAIEILSKPGLVFRGHASKRWELKATLYREVNPKDPHGELHFERFKKYLIGKLDESETLSEFEIWAVGQHYGLKTPLLDWSVSCGVAMFFALNNDSDEFSPVLHILDARTVNESYCENFYESMEHFHPNLKDEIITSRETSPAEFGKILIDGFDDGSKRTFDWKNGAYNKTFHAISPDRVRMVSPKKYFSGRVIGQRGVFSYSKNTNELGVILQDCGLGDCLYSIEIAPSMKWLALDFLDSMNINHLTLFPDIAGAALYSNYKRKKYSVTDMDDLAINWL